MTRLLTNDEIENILDFIQPSQDIPIETAMSIVKNNKEKLRKQLITQKVYPEIIPQLKSMMEKSYESTIIQPGESVGVICAQSIGEKNTQTTLNSIDWTDKILYTKDQHTFVEPIGQMIDNLLEKNTDKITHIEENRTEYLEIPDGYQIPSTDENGKVKWYKIEAVTRHLPVGKLVKVITASGRTVMATQAKSFLVWNGKKFDGVLGSDVKVGDILPTTCDLQRPKHITTHFDMESIFPKTEYLYTTEVNKAIKYQKTNGGLSTRSLKIFEQLNGKEFTVPYNRYDTMLGRRKEYLSNCPDGIIYIHTSNIFVSHIPDKILLDNDFGFFVGIYLAEGWSTLTFVGISNKDEVIRKRVTDFCDRYGVTYHLVISQSKNVINGESHDLKIHSTLLARMFKRICDTGSLSKRFPEFAYTAPDDFIKGLIDGYFSGDGSVNKEDGSVSVCSISENLIHGISFLLSYYGIFGRISNGQPKETRFKTVNRIYNLRIRNGFAKQFAKNIILTEGRKQEKLTKITLKREYSCENGRSQEKFPINRDVFFDKVVSVEYVDGTTEYVYDLTVETTRNFQLFNGLNVRDTFHRAGTSEKTMTQGVPRFQELINATRKPRIVNHKIYLKEGNKTIEETRLTVGSNIVGLSFADISKSICVKLNKSPEKWYEVFKVLYHEDFINHPHCISIKLNMKKLFEYKVTIEDIAKFIHKEYDDLFCVFSPASEGQIDIFVDTSNIELPENRILFVTKDNAEEIYLEECVQPIIEKMIITGIQGITEVFYTKENDEWIVETNGINSRTIASQYNNFKKLLALDIVDEEKTTSNNVWDIYEIFGIEAAREFLVEEFSSIMDGINTCHSSLLVDRMTYGGNISSITRYTMKKDESGPFGKASFEETMDNFMNAAAKGEIEPTEGVSASIICGKRANIGTGMVNVKLNIKKLPMFKNQKSKEEEIINPY
jgi:DNA-directed RNA polymerase subunit A"